jgi:hypothetical protein
MSNFCSGSFNQNFDFLPVTGSLSPLKKYEKTSKIIADQIAGNLPINFIDAKKIANSYNLEFRKVGFLMTSDYKEDRLNFTIRKGMVTDVYLG